MNYEIGKLIIVTVTKEDIENGLPNQGTCCPIALAVCRALGEVSEDLAIEVDGDINIPDERVEVQVVNDFSDMYVTKFIRLFDQEEYVYPFSFGIKIYEKDDSDWDEDSE